MSATRFILQWEETMKCFRFMLIFSIVFMTVGCSDRSQRFLPGLIGAYYGNPDLTRIKLPEVLTGLDKAYDEDTGHGSSWSGKYEGFLVAPVTGDVTITLETSKHAVLQVGEAKAVAQGDFAEDSITLPMKEKELIPVTLSYLHGSGGKGHFRVSCRWDEKDDAVIPVSNIVFTEEEAARFNYVLEPDPKTVDHKKFVKVPGKHVMVFSEPGRFGGWPANNGIWIWDDEIVVGLIHGYYRASELHHSVVKNKPMTSVLARSLDGGETWAIEDPDHFVGDAGKPNKRTGDIDFTHPDFALRCNWNGFWISHDRGRTWSGMYLFPKFGRDKLTARTDYIVNGAKDCLFFMATEEKTVQAQLQDYAFCARTRDGGKTFEFLSWMCEEDLRRSVMPSTVRIAEQHLISALRRRHDVPYQDKPPLQTNWIDVYQSKDNGETWAFLSKVANTDLGKRNGNPPSLVRPKDGRLCCTYGYRSIPYGIRAKISSDNGKTWGKELHLRDDARTWDIGYTRSVQRSDGKIVTVYYYTTETNEEQHIAATIWDPDEVQ